MQPTNHGPAGSPGPGSTPKPNLDAPLASNEPTSGPEGSTYEAYSKKTEDGIQAILDSGKQAVDSGKKWLEDSDLAGKAKELPQKAKDLGEKALDSFNALTLTQKTVSVGVLAAGVAFLITHSSRKKHHAHKHEPKPKPGRRPQDDFFGHQPHTRKGNEPVGRGQRPWGANRFGAPTPPAPGGKPRVQAGSGPGPQGPRGNNRRDQGPARGNRYDARTGGHQNPNNLDDLSSTF